MLKEWELAKATNTVEGYWILGGKDDNGGMCFKFADWDTYR